MAAKVSVSFKDAAVWARAYAGPPTEDDVTILADGTRIDTEDKARKWLAALNTRGTPAVDA